MAELSGHGAEWAAVGYFYSAYHRVRAAMLADPIFSSVQRLVKVNVKLTMEDRTATHHQGRRSDNGHRLGVNEIVILIYPVIGSEYRALHQASVDVRYGSRLLAPLDDLRTRCERIHRLGDSGRLVAVAT